MSDNKGNRPTLTDAIRQVLAGDVNAYAVVVKEYNNQLRSFVGRRYGHRGASFVEEVVNRTITRGFEEIKHYNQERSSFLTWLCWQARAEAKAVIRERFDKQTFSLDEGRDVEYVAADSDPAEEHERKVRDRVLREEFRALAEDGRLSIACHDLGDWTFSATAGRVGITVPQVRYRRKQALAELKQRVLRRQIQTVEVVPVYGRRTSELDDDDDMAARPVALLPDGPDTLSDAAVLAEEEDTVVT